MNREELCECTFTEEEIRNSVGLPEGESSIKSIEEVRQKYIKNMSPEERKESRERIKQLRCAHGAAFLKRKKERENESSIKTHE
jgi:hypothetical protein